MRESRAEFIAPIELHDNAPRFRRSFSLETDHGPVVSALLKLSALGICEAWINGRAVSENLFTPGWTSYEWRLHSVEHEVSHLLMPESVIALTLGNGWYRGKLGWMPTEKYGSEIAAFADLVITYADGFESKLVTDRSWKSSPGEVLSNDFYEGQTIDARLADTNWLGSDFDDSSWGKVKTIDYPGVLEPDPAPAVKRIAELAPQRIWLSPSGKTLLDFGANIVGWLRFNVRGAAGETITIRHAEVLESGELCTRPLRTALSIDRLILSGREDFFEPTMTFHGFRYAEISGWPGGIEALREASICAVVISSDLTRTGHFECSVPDLNQFHRNVVRGMQGNFIDIPTDCPQRDERLGWTGDLAVFAPSASFLFDVKSFLSDWLVDLELEQINNHGVTPLVIPDKLKFAKNAQDAPSSEKPIAIWGDATVWVPWAIWQAYGDLETLSKSFQSMIRHGRAVANSLSPSKIWDQGFQFGDWLDPDAPAEHPEKAKADPGVVATACAFRTASLIAKTASLLNQLDIEKEFSALAKEIKIGFRKNFVSDSRIFSDCATVYALAICFELLEVADLKWAGERLAELVAGANFKISTGFAGTPFVTDALCTSGQVETAYALLLNRACPSWLYPVTMGATTIWERWDSMLPDGSINQGDMTSFNHYALGAVADWLHKSVAGLAPLEPGYSKVLVAPQICEGIDWAKASLETKHGAISVSWARRGNQIVLNVQLPQSVSATVRWPGMSDQIITSRTNSVVLELPKPVSKKA